MKHSMILLFIATTLSGCSLAQATKVAYQMSTKECVDFGTLDSLMQKAVVTQNGKRLDWNAAVNQIKSELNNQGVKPKDVYVSLENDQFYKDKHCQGTPISVSDEALKKVESAIDILK